ncbi:cell wall hydrolase [Rhizobium terrae]|uniref:cell wall hydrolase n=1 Tax=Rhizobium terrae TaxID=2171756 RepID=UPI003857A573
MYFESQRSSRDGLMAVGTVIMNRLTSQAYASTICGVVGQEKQFAPGVLTREVKATAAPELDEAVDAIIRGERNPEVKDAMFFHKDGLKFPYKNMHYVTVAGGNAFYEKRDRDGELQTPPPKPADEYVLALVQSTPDPLSLIQAKEFDVASVPGTDPALPTVVPVPAQRPDFVTVHTASAQPSSAPAAPTPVVSAPAAPASAALAMAPTSQIVLANSASNEWMLRFDTGSAKGKRLPAGIDR